LHVIIPFNIPLGGCAWYVFQSYSASGEVEFVMANDVIAITVYSPPPDVPGRGWGCKVICLRRVFSTSLIRLVRRPFGTSTTYPMSDTSSTLTPSSGRFHHSAQRCHDEIVATLGDELQIEINPEGVESNRGETVMQPRWG